MDIQSLPTGFGGNDIAKTHEQLLPPKKDEFETTEAYAARTQSLAEPRTFFFPLEGEATVYPRYNADRQTLIVTVRADFGVHENYRSDRGRVAFVVREQDKRRRSYAASNAFGATIEVTATDSTAFALIPTNQPLRFETGSFSTTLYEVGLPMTADAARKAKDDILVLLVCRTTPSVRPAATTGFKNSKPTIDSPYDTSVKYRYLKAELLEVWLAGRRSGEIFLKDRVK